MNYGIIMAGGKGERFWPLSRSERPKQFLKLTSDRTMLEETIERVRPLIPLEQIRIVTGESMTQMILHSSSHVNKSHILSEPFGRNTCMAIGLAATHLAKADPTAVMVVLSADHLIRPPEKLLRIIEDGCAIATTDSRLITIGIVPTRPETGYGYIKLGELFKTERDSNVFNVAAFTEKPKAAVAQEYYFSRKYLWNSGMFIWSARSILKSIGECRPEIGELLSTYSEAIGTPRELAARQELYQKAPSISIDYAVLEKAGNVVVIKADIIWDDIGSWNALDRFKERDSDNNVRVGQSVVLDTFETTIYNEDSGLITCLGVSDLVIVRSGNVTLVTHKTRAGDIKELLAKLSEDESTRGYL
jgi:mannose-1-phosphate guanylyltransferase